ncbi:hypothetical protein EIP75_18365 [Aquabacterium soli]|uniref:Uncharacterized protein n=1 Tax=Aquabacterium soli TaxID=2493092 RepID=A0A426V7V6_9BURK|nr:hypothetical protein [Aquabacterium soli]RRS02922.1 hypothetical protein EIP75_18365 [Aquabacterium soli]
MTPIELLVIAVTADQDTPIGKVQINEAGLLTLLSATPEQSDYLEGWVHRLNEREDFTLKVVPPASAGAPTLSTHGRRFSRSQPSFLDDLKAYVRQLYGIKLMSQAELSQPADGIG